MKQRSKVFTWSFVVSLAAALGALAVPRDAHAIFRAGAHVGVEHVRGSNGNGTMLQYRFEGAFSLVPWVQLGAYAQGLTPFEGQTGWGGGALITLRPLLPRTRWDPMGFATVGYQRAPAGSSLHNAFTVELGGGLVRHVNSILDLEFRAGYVGLLNSSLHGFTGNVGLSLNL
ncbi:MAG: hypothetical protein U0324_08550 [Polyangiales bacterium]